MNGAEHYAEAERLLALSGDLPPNAAKDVGAITVAQAQVHATLAMFEHLREIGDQLDTLPRKSGVVTEDDVMRCAHGAVICGLCGYGVPAGDGGRS
jgi:hypothetical protein